jgi:hypothetical protein
MVETVLVADETAKPSVKTGKRKVRKSKERRQYSS